MERLRFGVPRRILCAVNGEQGEEAWLACYVDSTDDWFYLPLAGYRVERRSARITYELELDQFGTLPLDVVRKCCEARDDRRCYLEEGHEGAHVQRNGKEWTPESVEARRCKVIDDRSSPIKSCRREAGHEGTHRDSYGERWQVPPPAGSLSICGDGDEGGLSEA